MILPENAVLVDEGSSFCYVEPYEDGKRFCKELDRTVKKSFRSMLGNAYLQIRPFLPVYHHVNFRGNKSSSIEKEVKTLNLWKEEGFNVPKILKYSSNDISFNYIKGKSLFDILKLDSNDKRLDESIELLLKTKDLAYSKKNSDYLHSDPNFGNFYFDEENSSMIMIDPGMILRDDLSLDELYAGVLMQSLLSITKLKYNADVKEQLTQRIANTLPKEDINLILEHKKDLSPVIKAGLFGKKFIQNTFFNEKEFAVSNNLCLNFELEYDSFMKPILKSYH